MGSLTKSARGPNISSSSSIMPPGSGIFARLGLPREILMDCGANFTSRLLQQVCDLLQIKKLRTSIYHPQPDRLVEWFNRTLKDTLRTFPPGELRQWYQLLPPLTGTRLVGCLQTKCFRELLKV
uniref:Integrase catalytic domain-containing protein n=1 Tax=Chrysemys picta bellii TaxID=8478 RepID=A0A8C3IP07_CHRPI